MKKKKVFCCIARHFLCAVVSTAVSEHIGDYGSKEKDRPGLTVRKDIPEEATSKLRPEKGILAFQPRGERGLRQKSAHRGVEEGRAWHIQGPTGGSQWLEGTVQAGRRTTREEAEGDAGPDRIVPVRRRRLTLTPKAVRNH